MQRNADGTQSGWARAALICMVLLYTARMSRLALLRYGGFGAYAFDLGIFDQALWLMRHGRVPFVTVRGVRILGDHFTPCLIPLSVLYLGNHGTLGLLIFQALALAMGAVPAFHLALRSGLTPKVSLLVAAAYLLHPALQRMNLFDFHPIALATPALLWTLASSAGRRHAQLATAVLLTLACKEEAALAVLAAAAYTWGLGQRRTAAIMAVASVLWMLAALQTMKVLAGAHEQQYLQLYDYLGRDVPHILAGFVLRPMVVLNQLAQGNGVDYLLLLWVPVGLLPLVRPRLLLLSSPLYLINLLSCRWHMRTIDFQYNALIIPFLILSAIEALGLIPPGRRRLASLSLAICVASCALAASPAMDPWYGSRWVNMPGWESLLRRVPPEAPVSATSTLLPHMSQRLRIYMFPNPMQELAWGANRKALREELGIPPEALDRAAFQLRMAQSGIDFIAIRTSDTTFLGEARARQYMRYALSCEAFAVVARAGPVILLERGADHWRGLRLLGLPNLAGKAPAQVEELAWRALGSP